MKKDSAWILYFFALAAAAGVLAQITGRLEGTISDPSGNVIVGAHVQITEEATSLGRTVETDTTGRYVVPGLAPGSYRIEVSHPGFRTEVRRHVELAAGRSVRNDLRLEIGKERESVKVVAEVPVLGTSAGDWGGSIDEQALESLPLNGRDLFDLSAQEPSATIPATTKQSMTVGQGIHVSVNGARPNQNSFRIDGAYMNDASNSAPASAAGHLLGLESVQGLRLVTSPFSAEYGRSAGAVLTAVSRSGSNTWHGSAYGYFRDSALDARNYFDPAGEEIPPLHKQQFGGVISGPVRRNKTFFFVNYEGIRQTESRTLRPITITEAARKGILPGPGGGAVVPVAPEVKPYLELYPLPNGRDFGDGTAEYVAENTTDTREDFVSGKLDYLFSDTLRFAARYTFDDAAATAPDPFKIWKLTNSSRYQFIPTSVQYVQSATVIHTFRADFSRVRNTETSIPRPDIPASMSFIRGQPLGAIRVSGLTDLGGVPIRLRPRQYVVNDYQFSYEGMFQHGVHSIRVGAGYDRVQFNQQADLNAAGHYRFNSVEDLLRAKARSGDLMGPGSVTVRGWRQNQYYGFLQDEIQALRRLSITLGVRYEAYSTPGEVNGRIATLRNALHDTATTIGEPLFDNPSAANFAPRAALAWDVTGSGRTVIRAGAGIFFDLIGTRELLIAGVRMPPFFSKLSVARPEFPNLEEAAAGAPPLKSLDGLDYWLCQPYVGQYQFSVEHQIGAGLVVQAGYAGSRGIHLPGQIGNINPPTPEILADGRLHFPKGNPRLNPAFDAMGYRRTQFNSFYNAFQTSLRRRWSSGFRAEAKYAWSKLIDETSTTVFNDNLVTDQLFWMFNYRQNRGRSDYDIRHVFAGNFSYEIPEWHGTTGKILGGWQIHGLVRAQSGPPFGPEVGFDRANLNPKGYSLGQRPDYAGGPAEAVILGDPARYFDPEAFTLPEAGFYGNLGRNVFDGPGLFTLDAGIHKVIWKTERQNLWLRLELFNLANHPNFRLPSGLKLFRRGGHRLSSAGRITATSTTSRQIQLAVKWTF